MGKQSRLKALRKQFKENAAKHGIPKEKFAFDFVQQHKVPKKGKAWLDWQPDPQYNEAIQAIYQVSKNKQ